MCVCVNTEKTWHQSPNVRCQSFHSINDCYEEKQKKTSYTQCRTVSQCYTAINNGQCYTLIPGTNIELNKKFNANGMDDGDDHPMCVTNLDFSPLYSIIIRIDNDFSVYFHWFLPTHHEFKRYKEEEEEKKHTKMRRSKPLFIEFVLETTTSSSEEAHWEKESREREKKRRRTHSGKKYNKTHKLRHMADSMFAATQICRRSTEAWMITTR